MAHFYRQGLLVLVLLIIISECRDISAVTVFATIEEDAVLPCFSSYVMDPRGCDRFKLIKYATDSSPKKVILARPTTTNAKGGKWEVNGSEQVSIVLKNAQLSDEGLYGCEIWIGWDCIFLKNISLKVKDCKNLPGVKANTGGPVNLHCPVDQISRLDGPRNISWVRVMFGNAVSLSERVEMNGTSLAFLSVQPSDSGWYRCKYVLGQTHRCFEMNLQVQDKNDVVATTIPGLEISETIWHTKTETETETETKRSSGAFLPVLVTSVIIGTAITAALIGLFIYRRRNTQRVTQETHRHTPPDTRMDVYDIVNPPPSEARDHTLYEQFLDESLCTFR